MDNLGLSRTLLSPGREATDGETLTKVMLVRRGGGDDADRVEAAKGGVMTWGLPFPTAVPPISCPADLGQRELEGGRTEKLS